MSDYPTKMWEAAGGRTYETEGEAVEASKKYLTVQYMLDTLVPDNSLGLRARPSEELNYAVGWFVANPETILEVFEAAKKHAETKVVPS